VRKIISLAFLALALVGAVACFGITPDARRIIMRNLIAAAFLALLLAGGVAVFSELSTAPIRCGEACNSIAHGQGAGRALSARQHDDLPH
jgi:hypothetical protein